MIPSQRLMQRLSGALAASTLLLVLNGCGQVAPVTGSAAPQGAAALAPTSGSAAEPADAPLPTVVVEGEPAAPIPTISAGGSTLPPVPPEPAAAPSLAGDVQFDTDFGSSSDLSAWRFADTLQDPAGAPEWTVEGGRLQVPFNVISDQRFNDVLAITGPAQGPDYTFEAVGLARTSSILGVVVGYTDPANYVALLLADDTSPNSKALQLVQVVNGEKNVLASGAQLLQTNSWYNFQVQVVGTEITASLNGSQVLTGTASAPLGQQVGLYGSSEGGAFFSSVRLTLR